MFKMKFQIKELICRNLYEDDYILACNIAFQYGYFTIYRCFASAK